MVSPTKTAGIESVARGDDGPVAGRWRSALWVVFAVGALIRLSNIVTYPTFHGFDVKFNWEYVQRLCQSWELPRPDASTWKRT